MRFIRCLLVLPLIILGLHAPAADFARGYGTAGAGQPWAEIKGTALDSSGNTYVAGRFYNMPSIAIGSVTLTAIGGDAFVAKLDASGNTVWARNFGGSGANALAYGVAVDGPGNVYVTGAFEAASLTVPPLARIGAQDAFVVKLDASGNVTWAKNFGGTGSGPSGIGIRYGGSVFAEGAGVAVDGAGNVYVGGYYGNAALTTPPLSPNFTSAFETSPTDAFLIKLDASGNVAWARSYGGGGAVTLARGIAVDGAGQAHLVGWFRFADLSTPPLTKFGGFNGGQFTPDAFALKVDTAGNLLWARNFGAVGAQTLGEAIAVDNAANVYVAGYFGGADLSVPALTRIGGTDALAVKLDVSGNIAWARNFGGSNVGARGHGIAVNGGKVYLTGYHFGSDGATLTTPPMPNIGSQNGFVTKLDLSGTTELATNFGGTGADMQSYTASADGAGSVYLGGMFRGDQTSPPLTFVGYYDAFILKHTLAPPVVTTGVATSVTMTAATLNGTVDLPGVITLVYFDLGATTAYDESAGPPVVVGPGSAPVSLSAPVGGRTCGTTYHFRIRAVHATGTVNGNDATFTTAACPPGALSVQPASHDFGGQSINTTSAPRNFILTNTGGVPVAISSVTASAHFAAAHDCTTLAPGGSCGANANFTPGFEGTIFGSLTVQSDIGTTIVPLNGTGERSLVTHFYQSVLRRAPDPSGGAHWQSEVSRLQSLGANVNETWYAMAAAFYASPEYQVLNRNDTGFVTDLYDTFFNRPPDSGGLAHWTGLISQGMPREVVLASFMFSSEFASFTQAIFGNTAARKEVDMVMDFYRGLLLRLPDTGGFNFWVGRFRTAQCVGAAAVQTQANLVSREFIESPEYQANARTNAQFVGDLYNAFLRRGGDLQGVQYWIGQLDSGARTREQVRFDFVGSPEFSARVDGVIAQGCQQ